MDSESTQVVMGVIVVKEACGKAYMVSSAGDQGMDSETTQVVMGVIVVKEACGKAYVMSSAGDQSWTPRPHRLPQGSSW